MGLIIDLDQTILDTSIAEQHRANRNWAEVYKLIPSFKVYSGIHELLSQIREMNVKIAIVTTSPSIYTEKITKYFNIPYDVKVCYHDVPRRKPFPDQMLLAIKQLKLNPSRTLSLGDRAIDIKASKDAGIKSCACFWGTKERDLLQNSEYDICFSTVEDAKNYMLEYFR
jgi:HAD superfamily hydrolase (TIGR01509 family)